MIPTATPTAFSPATPAQETTLVPLARWRLALSQRLAAWLMLLGIGILLALPPQLIVLPVPEGGMVLQAARLEEGEGPAHGVTLPHAWSPVLDSEEASARYQITFQGAALAGQTQTLFIPMVRQHIDVWLNGVPIPPENSNIWANPRTGYYFTGILPAALIQPGENALELRLDRADGWISGYVSKVHLIPQRVEEPQLRIRDILVEQWWAISLALQFLLAASVVMILLLRRHDPVYLWLGLMAAASILAVVMQSPILYPFGDLRPYSALVQAGVGVLSVLVAQAVTERPRRALLPLCVLGVLIVLLAGAMAGFLPVPLSLLLSALVAVSGFGLAALILGHDFAETQGWVSAILAVPFGLTCVFGFHDIAMAFGLTQGAFMLTPYSRLLILLAVMSLLNGRLAQSLNRLDTAHTTLQSRLADREAELTTLHRQERSRAALRVLSDERERLTRDLHDGISGHLVSILAQSELGDADPRAINMTAREALEDLRLVVLSLDLGEDELRLALAGFRERLEVHLRRQKVALNWSMESLPDVAGMTPGHGLTILRILQEAVTNALKHGPATILVVRGQPGPDGSAEILVRNDGDPTRPASDHGQGHGLENMKQRARALGGEAIFSAQGAGGELLLRLPIVLGAERPRG